MSITDELRNVFDRLKTGWFSFSVDDHQHTFLLLRDFIGVSGVDKRTEPEYSGELANGKPEGLGVMAYVEPWKLYVGEWHKGKPHGRGFMNYSLSERYVGEWEDGLRHGYGITVFEGRRMAVYYYEWKGQYVHDRWEGEDALEERERQRFPSEMHFGMEERKALDKLHAVAVDGEEYGRILSRQEALDNLGRTFQVGWKALAVRYPRDFPELNRIIQVKPIGLWCLKCRHLIGPSENGTDTPVEKIFDLTIVQQGPKGAITVRQLETPKQMYGPGFDRRDDGYYSLSQRERFVHQYFVLYKFTPEWMRRFFLTSYAEDRLNEIGKHLREVHDWQIARRFPPDIELNLRFSGSEVDVFSSS